MQYNTQSKKLVLPEYGRSIQQMVDYCVTIPDREERTFCAYSIVRIMMNLFPELAKDEENYHRFWDHINLMSGFKLNIDFPCDVITEDVLNPKPERLPYRDNRIHYRYYGKMIEDMIEKVASMEESEERFYLVMMIATHLKKLLTLHNKEGVSDAKVIADLAELSGGRIILDPQTHLPEFKEPTAASSTQSKKRKKK